MPAIAQGPAHRLLLVGCHDTSFPFPPLERRARTNGLDAFHAEASSWSLCARSKETITKTTAATKRVQKGCRQRIDEQFEEGITRRREPSSPSVRRLIALLEADRQGLPRGVPPTGRRWRKREIDDHTDSRERGRRRRRCHHRDTKQAKKRSRTLLRDRKLKEQKSLFHALKGRTLFADPFRIATILKSAQSCGRPIRRLAAVSWPTLLQPDQEQHPGLARGVLPLPIEAERITLFAVEPKTGELGCRGSRDTLLQVSTGSNTEAEASAIGRGLSCLPARHALADTCFSFSV